MDALVTKWTTICPSSASVKQIHTMHCVFVQLHSAWLKLKVRSPESLLYVELLALDCSSVREEGQRLADSPELLLPLLELSIVFKVCGGWQGESIPDPNHKSKQDQRHDPLGPWRTHCLHRVKAKADQYLFYIRSANRAFPLPINLN